MAEQPPINIHKINPPGIVEKVPSSVNSTVLQDAILKELNLLKIDIPETIAEQERKVMELIIKELKEKWKKIPDGLYVKFIAKWVFASWTKSKDVTLFVSEKGESIINIYLERKRPFIWTWEVLDLEGFIEKIEDWEHKLFRKGSNTPINQLSIEFLEAWKDIDFVWDIFWIKFFLEKKIPFDFGHLRNLIKSWTLRFQDLEEISAANLIEKENYDFAMKWIKDNLIKQWQDKRLIDYWIWIKEKDLIIYFRKKYIDGTLMNQCANVLPPEMRLKESDIKDLFNQKYITFKEAGQLVNTLSAERKDLSGK